MSAVIGIDPGKTSGVAFVDGCSGSVDIITCGDYDTRDSLYATIRHLVTVYHVDMVVIEDFIGSGPRTPAAILTLKLIGFLEGMLTELDITHRLQPPQWRKPFLREAKEFEGVPHHSRDALAHALFYLYQSERDNDGNKD